MWPNLGRGPRKFLTLTPSVVWQPRLFLAGPRKVTETAEGQEVSAKAVLSPAPLGAGCCGSSAGSVWCLASGHVATTFAPHAGCQRASSLLSLVAAGGQVMAMHWSSKVLAGAGRLGCWTGWVPLELSRLV